jgi:RNA polymerase sigma factor (sigma-70 family)
MYEVTDEEIVAKIRSGNIQLFEMILRRYQKKLITFIYSVVGSEADADDIVQEAFISVYKHIDNIDPRRKFSPYLFQVAKNSAYSFLRSKNHQQISLDAVSEIEFDAEIFEKLIIKEESHKVKKELLGLDMKYSKILQLYYFSDLSYEEISQKIKIPLNSVRTRIKRAKENLRKLIYEK